MGNSGEEAEEKLKTGLDDTSWEDFTTDIECPLCENEAFMFMRARTDMIVDYRWVVGIDKEEAKYCEVNVEYYVYERNREDENKEPKRNKMVYFHRK